MLPANRQYVELKKLTFYYSLLSLVFFLTIFSSCRKDNDFPDANGTLAFSADTLTFDTVFTTVGSATGVFKIYNPNKKKVVISSIRLGGGSNSPFRLNVDGIPTNTIINNIEIAGKDSMYIFVKVTVDPKNQSNPFVILDSVIFESNGSFQDVKLMAWGQYALFYKNSAICNTTWKKDTPIVIINYALVDSGCTLTVDAGARIYFHPGAALLVKGTLVVNGTKTDSVVFQGDRLESFFYDIPGQWDGIYFLRMTDKGSTNNLIKYVIIKNSMNGIISGLLSDTAASLTNPNNIPVVKIQYSTFKNILGSGIASFTSNIEVINSLIYNCGQNNIVTFGGTNNFYHCTIANFGTTALEHKTPIVGISNFYNNTSLDLNSCNFINCIIYGGLEEEIDTLKKGSGFYNYSFENCIVKTKRNTSSFISTIKNSDPVFNDISKDDYHLKSNSPAINNGKSLIGIGISDDMDSKSRDSQPDIGCYEY